MSGPDPAAPTALVATGEQRLESRHGLFRAHGFDNPARQRPVLVLSLGNVGAAEPLLARVHSSCATSEVYGGCDCDCAGQLDVSLARVARQGRGIVFYLMQEGRGAGLTAKARDRMIVQASGNRKTTFEAYAEMGLPSDLRDYAGVGAMAAALGIRAPLDLMTNNPQKAEAVAAALATVKLDLRRTRGLVG